MKQTISTDNHKRETFGSRLGFILVSAGCAVGLGNVWKFPYICGEYGGAAFILLYLLFLVFLGLPILICEFSIGRGSQLSIGGALKKLESGQTIWHKYRWFGFAGNYLLMMFYTMVAGWMLHYVYLSATNALSGDTAHINNQFSNMLASPATMTFWTLFVIAVCIIVCAFGLKNGVERITKIMMLLLITLMIVMAIYSVTLPGASKGLRFYLIPDFKRMFEQGIGNVLFAAMSHAFFTLSVGMGSMEIFGSYLTKERKLTGEAISVVCLDTMIALTAGIIIIPACFSCSIEPDAGPSLLFITLPGVFQQLPAGTLWATLFFVFMSFAALSTVIAVFENIIAMTIDLIGVSHKTSVLLNLIGITLLSLPAIFGFNLLKGITPFGAGSTIMDVEDFLVSYNILPLGSLLFVLFCVRKNGWGFEHFLNEANQGSGISFPRFLRGYMTYVLPLIILFVYFKGYYDMFHDKEPLQFFVWMGISVICAGFVLFISLYKPSKKELIPPK